MPCSQVRTIHRQGLVPGTSRPSLALYAGPIHPPKHEKFDLTARTNTDPKGIVLAVDVYTVEPWGLYMARPTPRRPQFHYLESWLLPSIGFRASVFRLRGSPRPPPDLHPEVGSYSPRP